MAQPSRPAFTARRSHRRARVALASALALFVAGQTGLALALHGGWKDIRDPDFSSRVAALKDAGAGEAVRPWRVTLLGTSRTQWGIRPRLLERQLSASLGHPVSVCSLGRPGGGVLRSLLDLYRLRRRGVRPDLLVVEVLPAFLADEPSHDELSDVVLPTALLDWEDLEFLERYAPAPRRDTVRRDWLLSMAFPCHGQRRALLSRLAPNLLPASQRLQGCTGDAHPANPEQVSAPGARAAALVQARRQYARTLAHFRLGKQKCAALRELLGVCRADGLPAALVVLPEGPTFRNFYRRGAWAHIERFLARTARAFGARLVSARGWVGREADFFDSHHLLPAGAERVTARLGREALGPLLRRSHLPAEGAVLGERRSANRVER
jgi:hypothetical protein